jgi:predicted PurR-regulated permease PerM
VTTTDPPRRGRGTAIGEGVTWTGQWSLRLILVAAGLAGLWWLIGQLWSIVLPVLLAVILASLLWPPTAWLRRHKFPPAAAAAAVLLGGIVVLAGLITVITTSVAGSAPEIARSAQGGLQAIQDWLSGPPLNLAQSELDAVLQTVTNQLQQSVSTITSSLFAGLGGLASGVVTALLTLVLAFLFVKDGPRFLPWLESVAGAGPGRHLAEVLRRVWKSVGGFIRVQAVVALADAVLIGIGLVIVGVPLALPLAVLTFLGGFVPIVGALVAGALSVLVALVSNGFTAALIVLAIILAVQQLEGNVLQPYLQGRSLKLHAAVVLLAVTAGGTLYGIGGAFLAVPVVAAAAVVLRYLGERVDERSAARAGPRVGPPEEAPTAPSDPGGAAPAADPTARGADPTAPGAATAPRVDPTAPRVEPTVPRADPTASGSGPRPSNAAPPVSGADPSAADPSPDGGRNRG